MQVQFYTFGFDTKTYNFSVVKENSLCIITSKGEIEIEFETEKDANEAQKELCDLIEQSNTSTISSVFNTVSSTLGDLFSKALVGTAKKSVQSTVQSKVQSASKQTKTTLDEMWNKVGEEVEGMVGKLQTAINSAKQTVDAGNKSNDDLEHTFNVEIAQLSDAQLSHSIDVIADKLMRENDMVKEFLVHLREYNTEDEIQQVIKSHKERLFEMARENDDMTLQQIVDMYLS